MTGRCSQTTIGLVVPRQGLLMQRAFSNITKNHLQYPQDTQAQCTCLEIISLNTHEISRPEVSLPKNL